MNSSKKGNQLTSATSPYLKQHAYNPVDWYPWGAEALEKARNEDKPIILSIGYSACHWCHVMERESFENEDIAAIMNEYFVSIKVDREERPDIDQIYMEAIQAMGLNGGWPLNVILLPDQRPFYGGTYFPAQNWANLLTQVARAFRQHREELENSAGKFQEILGIDEIQKYGLDGRDLDFERITLEKGLEKFIQLFDKEYGGVEKAPKFPMPGNWNFLLYYSTYHQQNDLQEHLNFTLEKMALGGIYDQIGGGFARYSVDRYWFAPHFEKMLYDNGQLISLYAKAYRWNSNPLFREVVFRSIEWLSREMKTREGAFYSALDADSEGEEGKYYVWKESEIDKVLGVESSLFKKYYGITPGGNWENGSNILKCLTTKAQFARENKLNVNDFIEKLSGAENKLLDIRHKRVKPALDDKILSGWNGLMITGLCDAYLAFSNEKHLMMAKDAANFIRENLMNTEGRLFRLYTNGSEKIYGFLEDYAAVIECFLALYQSTFDETWLSDAKKLSQYCFNHFFDKKTSYFFFTEKNSEGLIARKKEIFDNVIPSSNSLMALNLFKLGHILDEQAYLQTARKMVLGMKSYIANDINYTSHWALVYHQFLSARVDVVVDGPESEDWAKTMLKNFYGNLTVIKQKGHSIIPLTKEKNAPHGKTAAFVCLNKSCKMPTLSLSETLDQLPRQS